MLRCLAWQASWRVALRDGCRATGFARQSIGARRCNRCLGSAVCIPARDACCDRVHTGAPMRDNQVIRPRLMWRSIHPRSGDLAPAATTAARSSESIRRVRGWSDSHPILPRPAQVCTWLRCPFRCLFPPGEDELRKAGTATDKPESSKPKSAPPPLRLSRWLDSRKLL
jgi:hypothetical protein